MDSTTLTASDRRRAHLRVGAAATAAFIALLLLVSSHGTAVADTSVTPAAAPAVSPAQPNVVPTDPSGGPMPGGDHDGDGPPMGDGDGFGGGQGGFGGGGEGGAPTAPSAPSSGSSNGAQT